MKGASRTTRPARKQRSTLAPTPPEPAKLCTVPDTISKESKKFREDQDRHFGWLLRQGCSWDIAMNRIERHFEGSQDVTMTQGELDSI